MLIPMPSPRGTNCERLFISAAHSPAAAYDAIGGLKAERLSDEELQTVLAILAGKLSDQELEKIRGLLTERSGANHETLAADGLRRGKAVSTSGFHARYPGAARIKQAW
jgi:hypothetical protein